MRKPYFIDGSLPLVVKEEMNNSGEETIDVNILTAKLMDKYALFQRKSFKAFRKSVLTALEWNMYLLKKDQKDTAAAALAAQTEGGDGEDDMDTQQVDSSQTATADSDTKKSEEKKKKRKLKKKRSKAAKRVTTAMRKLGSANIKESDLTPLEKLSNIQRQYVMKRIKKGEGSLKIKEVKRLNVGNKKKMTYFKSSIIR